MVIDSTPPVITITGDNPFSIEQYQTYTDAGATASDVSGSATVTSSGTVDTNTVGTYIITYTATDASGNTSTATRTVIVTADPLAPVSDIEQYQTYTDAGDNPVTVEQLIQVTHITYTLMLQLQLMPSRFSNSSSNYYNW